jgi:ABC-type phosphate/phosphonate transport system substrate-binding protein
MIAALPMYDWPETRGINDVIWARIAAKLNATNIDAPQILTRSTDLTQIWLSPDLLLAQTCSYPLQTTLKDKVRYVATPSYCVEGCEIPGHYRSVVLMRSKRPNLPVPGDDAFILPKWPATARFALNSFDSLSGYHALAYDLAMTGRALPAHHVETGSHRASIIAVANGEAELCGVASVSRAMAIDHEPAAQMLRVVGWSKQRPGLPLITALNASQTLLNSLISAARSVLGAVVLAKPTGA